MFSYQIIFLLLLSLLLSLLRSGISLARRSPTLVLGHEVDRVKDQILKKKITFLRITMALFSGLVTALLINAKENEKDGVDKTLEYETLDSEKL